MSSHPNRDAPIEIYRGRSGEWWWDCETDHFDDDGIDGFGKADTHAEALAAALSHCAKAKP